MIGEEDIIEIVADTIKEESWKNKVSAVSQPVLKKQEGPKRGFFAKEKYIQSRTSLPKGRQFISEYEIKQMIKDGTSEITVPANAIISPLAQEIIAEKGIKVKRV
ncbi:MAG: hypothetical protein AB1633_04215 [Elusimicrobiota bacterium]